MVPVPAIRGRAAGARSSFAAKPGANSPVLSRTQLPPGAIDRSFLAPVLRPTRRAVGASAGVLAWMFAATDRQREDVLTAGETHPTTSMERQIGDVERRLAAGLDHAAQLYAAVASKGEVDVSVQRCVSRLFLAQRAAEACLATAG